MEHLHGLDFLCHLSTKEQEKNNETINCTRVHHKHKPTYHILLSCKMTDLLGESTIQRLGSEKTEIIPHSFRITTGLSLLAYSTFLILLLFTRLRLSRPQLRWCLHYLCCNTYILSANQQIYTPTPWNSLLNVLPRSTRTIKSVALQYPPMHLCHCFPAPSMKIVSYASLTWLNSTVKRSEQKPFPYNVFVQHRAQWKLVNYHCKLIIQKSTIS